MFSDFLLWFELQGHRIPNLFHPLVSFWSHFCEKLRWFMTVNYFPFLTLTLPFLTVHVPVFVPELVILWQTLLRMHERVVKVTAGSYVWKKELPVQLLFNKLNVLMLFILFKWGDVIPVSVDVRSPLSCSLKLTRVLISGPAPECAEVLMWSAEEKKRMLGCKRSFMLHVCGCSNDLLMIFLSTAQSQYSFKRLIMCCQLQLGKSRPAASPQWQPVIDGSHGPVRHSRHVSVTTIASSAAVFKAAAPQTRAEVWSASQRDQQSPHLPLNLLEVIPPDCVRHFSLERDRVIRTEEEGQWHTFDSENRQTSTKRSNNWKISHLEFPPETSKYKCGSMREIKQVWSTVWAFRPTLTL